MSNSAELKAKTLTELRTIEAVFVMMSDCTKMPYVECDSETFDDEILLFFQEKDARAEMERIKKEYNLVHLIRLENKFLLSFLNSLFPMGVNCICINKNTAEEVAVQLNEVVRRPKLEEAKADQVVIENPAFHLTALYLAQEMRSGKTQKDGKELEEEMMAHFRKGKFIIVASKEGKVIPLLKMKDGQMFQPLFTDVQEVLKFKNMNKDQDLFTSVIEADKIPNILAKDAAGVVFNPLGLNLPLKMKK